MVLHHGLTGSLETWREFGYVDSLKSDYQLILMDARGHGASGKPHDTKAYLMEHRVGDIVLVSPIGWYLPLIFSGSLIVATVLNLPTIGPMLLRALVVQDMFLAGAIILIYCMLAIIGTIMSDILLAWLDPRIRMEEG